MYFTLDSQQKVLMFRTRHLRGRESPALFKCTCVLVRQTSFLLYHWMSSPYSPNSRKEEMDKTTLAYFYCVLTVWKVCISPLPSMHRTQGSMGYGYDKVKPMAHMQFWRRKEHSNLNHILPSQHSCIDALRTGPLWSKWKCTSYLLLPWAPMTVH